MTATKKRAQSEQTRRRLVDAATRLFAERGYAETSVKHIAEVAGISQGSIFWHFQSKQGLLLEVIDQAFGQWERGVLAPLIASQRPADLPAVIDAYATFARKNPEVAGRLFFILVSEALRPDSDLGDAYARIYERFRGYCRAWVDGAMANGSCRTDLDAEATATLIVGALAGIFQQWLVAGERMDFERANDDLAKILSRGVAPAPS